MDVSAVARFAYCLGYDIQSLVDAGVRVTAGEQLEWACQMRDAGFPMDADDAVFIGMRKWFELNFTDLVRPLYANSFFVLDFEKDRRRLDIQRALLTWQWMARTGAPYYECGRSGPYEAISASSCRGSHDADSLSIGRNGLGIDAELHRRFQWLLLQNGHLSESARRWMSDNGIELGATKRVPAQWFDSNAEGFDYLFFDFNGVLNTTMKVPWMQSFCEPLLKVQLNRCHDKARWVSSITLEVPHYSSGGSVAQFSLVLHYGYPHEHGGWKHVIAAQAEGESLWNFVRRWPGALNELLTVRYEEYPKFDIVNKHEIWRPDNVG